MRLIEVPPDVVATAQAALETRAERGAGGTARGVAIAAALSTGVVREHDVDEIAAWHAKNPEACTATASSLLGGLYGGPAARAWAGPPRRTAGAPLPQNEKLKRLSDKVNSIDRATVMRIHAAANVALDEALRNASVKLGVRAKRNAKTASVYDAAGGQVSPALLAAVGVTEQELLDRRFDVFGTTALTLLTAAERRKLRAAAQALGLDPDDLETQYADQIDTRAAAAAGFLVAGLSVLARATLSGHGIVPEDQKGEFAGPVPFGMVREAWAVAARGATPPAIDESGPGPAPIDDIAQRAVDAGKSLTETLVENELGQMVLIRTWRHGEPLRPFDPHEALDGASWIDAEHGGILDADPGEWPYVAEYEPGDHDGCTCWLDSSYETAEAL